jgi:cytochrome c biogenesis protein ResB
MTTRTNGILDVAPTTPSKRVEELLPPMQETIAAALRRESGLQMTEEQWVKLRASDEIREKIDDAAAKAAIVVVLDELHARIRKLEGPSRAEVEGAMATLQRAKETP